MDTYNLQDLLEVYAAAKNKTIVFIRNPALEKQQDVNIINQVWQFYKEHLPEEIYDAIRYSDFNILEFDHEYTAQQFVEDNFPSLDLVENSNYWFTCMVINPVGMVVYENNPIIKSEEPVEGA
jgi:hypothetical protein